MLTLESLVYASLATSAASITLTKSSLFERVREAKLVHRVPGLRKLLTCPYCTSHWVALLVSFLGLYEGILANLLTWLALVGTSAILMGLSIKLLHMDQAKLDGVLDQLGELRYALAEAELERDYFRDALNNVAGTKA